MNNGDHQTFRSECPTDLSKPYLPLDIFFKIKSKSLPKMQKQVDSSSDDDGDDDNDGKQFADDKLTLSRNTILEGEKLETLILAGELSQVEDKKAKELDDANEENVEDKPHEEDDQPQYHPRKKRKRKKKKTRKKGAKPPQPQDQQEKQTMSSEICTMTTRTKNAAPTPRPLSLSLSLSLPLPLRSLSLSPLRDGPLRDVPVKATTPEGMRSLHPITTLCVINENESIDDEPSNFDEVDAILTNDTQGNSETLTVSTLSTLSSILNSNRDRNGNQNLNNCNNNIKFNNDNNNNSNTNDNNNNKNNHFKVIISDYDGEINGDYNLRENSFDEYADRSDRLLEFTNERSNNSWLGESSSFSSLYRLESFDDSHFNDGCESPGLEGVKAMANRLKLATRRPSYQQWCDRYIGSSGVPRFPDLSPEEEVDEKLTEERKDRINSALEWIKNELGEMRTIDHNLATQLLTLRNDIHRLKLERSCENHQDLLDDVKDELSERETLSAVSDIPYDMADDNPLKHLGVTRMNISSRRFSMC